LIFQLKNTLKTYLKIKDYAFRYVTLRVFESVIPVAVQSVFGYEMYQNKIYFYFLNIIFYIITLKLYENIKN
jgi:hypothetical protein